MVVPAWTADVERSADPSAAGRAIDRLIGEHPGLRSRLSGDRSLRVGLVTVTAASPFLARWCLTDPGAVDILADLDRRPALDAGGDLARWKRREVLRIAARDLTGRDPLADVVAALSALADDLLVAACERSDQHGALAVIAMGKLGAEELNYASDIDLLFVGDGDPRGVLDRLRPVWRTDMDLRPEGRNGPLIRTLASYQSYWDRWARTWEFQALLKARPVAGDRTVAAAWQEAAAQRVWERPFGADELREVRAMKVRAEREMSRRGLTDRELKRGRGGIRDIEFAVQLLQLVHGRADPGLRGRATVPALAALADGGYVARDDADALLGAYRWLRTVEHRLQLWEDQPVHAVPTNGDARDRLARILGFRDGPDRTARAGFEEELRSHQATVRSIHERLFFRPLLEAFSVELPSIRPTSPVATVGPALSRAALGDRLAAFGFSDAARTRAAVVELTRGLSRSSHLWQQLLPLVMEWLSQAPDPDLGLLGLRSLAENHHARGVLTSVFRESAESARQLCCLLGTGPGFARTLLRRPDLLRSFASGPAAGDDADRLVAGQRSLVWRRKPREVQEGLAAWRRAATFEIAADDVLGRAEIDVTGRALTTLAESVMRTALGAVDTDADVPLAVIAMGRLGGRELSYASDLDVMLVFDAEEHDAEAARRAETLAARFVHLVRGETPATGVYPLDTSLRPEGRQGPIVRSLNAYTSYYARWAETWERQALLRSRWIAGDAELGHRFAAVAERFVWDRPLTDDDERAIRRSKARVERERIPAGEDPQFHLKLGRGSLSDVEWTVQLLQLRHGVRGPGTMDALDALVKVGALDPGDARILLDAYRFCERTRNRLALVRGSHGDALPAAGPVLTSLARSFGTTATGLREEYRRRTRRSRRVVERVFYGTADGA